MIKNRPNRTLLSDFQACAKTSVHITPRSKIHASSTKRKTKQDSNATGDLRAQRADKTVMNIYDRRAQRAETVFVLFPLELSDYRPVVGLLQVEKLSGQDTAEAITEDAPFCLRGGVKTRWGLQI